jgi:hypothetical protein
MIMLVPALLGLAVAAEPDREFPSEAQAVAISTSAECVEKMDALGPCWSAVFREEAEGFLTGNVNTLAEDMAKGLPKMPPEYMSLRGIRLPVPQPEVEGCGDRFKESFSEKVAAQCMLAKITVDFARWTRREKSEFGNAVAAIIARYRAYRSESGFQGARWGMTPAEVSKVFPKATRQASGDLLAKMAVADYPAAARFRFIDARLWAIEVAFSVDHARPDQDVRKTLDLRRLLATKYGDPAVEDGSPSGEEVPVETLMREIGGVGRSVRAGRMVMRAKWSAEEMEIELTLGSAIGEYAHRLVYRSEVFSERAGESRDASRSSEL